MTYLIEQFCSTLFFKNILLGSRLSKSKITETSITLLPPLFSNSVVWRPPYLTVSVFQQCSVAFTLPSLFSNSLLLLSPYHICFPTLSRSVHSTFSIFQQCAVVIALPSLFSNSVLWRPPYLICFPTVCCCFHPTFSIFRPCPEVSTQFSNSVLWRPPYIIPPLFFNTVSLCCPSYS